MNPSGRTEPELRVRVVQRLNRLFVLEDEHVDGEAIGTRQLNADGSWTGWESPACDVVDETLPAQVVAPVPQNYTQIIGGTGTATWTYPSTTSTTSPSMMTVSPGMLATITPTS